MAMFPRWVAPRHRAVNMLIERSTKRVGLFFLWEKPQLRSRLEPEPFTLEAVFVDAPLTLAYYFSFMSMLFGAILEMAHRRHPRMP